MKIAVWHNLPSGGGKRALYYHVKGLVQRGHTVESWCPSTADQSYLPLSDLINEHILPFPWKDRPKKTFISKVSATFFEIVEKLRAMDAHCRQCAEQINQRDFDILFANSCTFFRVTPISRYVKLPKVLYLQEPYRWLYEAMPDLPWDPTPKLLWAAPALPKRFWTKPHFIVRFVEDLVRVKRSRIQAREEWLNAREFDTILVNSYYSRESVLRAYGLDAKVCYLGIDTGLFGNQHLEKEDLVVGIGAIVPEKNIKFIIESLALVKEPRPRLVWIGNLSSPFYFEELKKTAKAANVVFEPKIRIEDSEVIQILNRALMMVYAPRLEPFGLAPLEANACGIPVVAVAEGGVRETVIHGINGLLVEHDEAAMAGAIQRLLDDRDYAKDLGKNGQKLVMDKWSFNSSIDNLEHRIAEVMSKRRKMR